MQGIIVQTAEIFDPSGVPEYARYLKTLFSFGYEEQEALAHLSVEERHKKSRWEVGTALYPLVLEYLKPLNVTGIHDIIDYNTGQPMGIQAHNIAELAAHVEEFASTWITFNASINPDVEVGCHDVKMRMNTGYSARDDKETRSVDIYACFDNPELARIGLGNLRQPFPELQYAEELWAIELPEEIRNLHMDARSYHNENFLKRGYNPAVFHDLLKAAMLAHFEFLGPLFPKLGIKPDSVFYHAKSPVLPGRIETRRVDIGSLSEAYELLKNSSRKNTFPIGIPMKASFVSGDALSGSSHHVGIEVNFGLYTPYEERPFQYAISIDNPQRKGILEEILEKVNSL